MAQQIIQNGETGLVVRTKMNENFTELYQKGYETVSLLDYMTATERANYIARNMASDHTAAYQAFINALQAGPRIGLVPSGTAKTTAELTVSTPIMLAGCGFDITAENVEREKYYIVSKDIIKNSLTVSSRDLPHNEIPNVYTIQNLNLILVNL